MKFDLKIPSVLLRRACEIDVIGIGGTGSALLPGVMQLHHALLQLGHPYGLHVTAYDPDEVSPSNIGRQGFFPADIGQNKAILLVNRLNMAWGTSWTAVPERYRYCDGIKRDADIVIGCVDSRKSRASIKEILENRLRSWLYIDSGNNENTGQVILGEILKSGKKKLPLAWELFPEIVDVQGDEQDDVPSCSVAASLERQSLFINRAISLEVLNLLWRLFRHGSLDFHGSFVNLQTGRVVPLPIDTLVWKKMGYVYQSRKN